MDQEIIAKVYHTRFFAYLRTKIETNEEIRQIEAEDLYEELDADEPLPERQPDDLPDPTTTDASTVAPEMTSGILP